MGDPPTSKSDIERAQLVVIGAGPIGLGMAIAKRLVEEQRGTIEAENDPEGGAVVRVRMPLSSAHLG